MITRYPAHWATWACMVLITASMILVPSRVTAGDARGKPLQQLLKRGVILIANESLRDPRFAQSVIFIIEYSEYGAAGVILNRPTVVRVIDAIPLLSEHLNQPDKIMYFGGPVGADSAQVLVTGGPPIEGADRVIDGVYAVNRMSNLVEHFDDETFEARTRFYGGYAGWGPGQLEAEVSRNDWKVIDGDADTVFSNTVENLWKDLHGQFSGLWVRRQSRPHSPEAARTIL